MSNPDPVQSSPSTVFIILRHVNNELTNQYWQLACQRISEYHPNSMIYIIDDHSRTEWLTPVPAVFLDKVTVINSELPPGRGEILPLYYFHKHKWAESAVIIHDSVYLQSTILDKIDSKLPVQFLWSFKYPHLYDNREIEKAQLKLLNYAAELTSIYYKMKLWFGCFGVMCHITWDYLNHLNEKYGLFSLVDHISNRPDRCSFERTFAIICHHDNRSSATAPTSNVEPLSAVYGTIQEYSKLYLNRMGFRLTYCEYIETIKQKEKEGNPGLNPYTNAPIIKVWSGR